jgi:histidinol phosphatase-like PHP family hydrolase
LAGLLWSAVVFVCVNCAAQSWVPLFDGKSLDGWQPSEVKTTWKVVDGCLVSGGGRSHLFYVGDVNQHEFKNFELKADVKTSDGANSGIYIHTHYQETGFPDTGYECQVINSYPPGRYVERKMTGSIYAIRNVWKAPVPDNVWFHYHIIVQGKTIQTYINDELLAEYTESAHPFRPADKLGRLLSSGTFALQGHDAKSVAAFKNIEVKVLPGNLPTPGQSLEDSDFEARIIQLSNDNFPLLDLDVRLTNGLTQEMALANARKYGYTYGIVINHWNRSDYRRPMQVFTGLRFDGQEELQISPNRGNTGPKYDYVIATAMTPDSMDEALTLFHDPRQFMDRMIFRIEQLAATKRVNIYAEATSLPVSLKADYDKLWTEERMDRVIKAMKDGNVAMEINDRLQVPSAAFIKRAKAAGVKFTFGSGNTGPGDLGRLSYCIAMISECHLTPGDLWFPF